MRIKTAKDMLAEIDAFLSSASEDESKALWNVLTALRGPDKDDLNLKRRTTARLRRRALPNAAAYVPAEFASEYEAQVPIMDAPSGFGYEKNWHFLAHIGWADRALLEMGL